MSINIDEHIARLSMSPFIFLATFTNFVYNVVVTK